MQGYRDERDHKAYKVSESNIETPDCYVVFRLSILITEVFVHACKLTY